MAQARAPVSVIYTCIFLTAGLIFVLVAYEGMFDGLWVELVDDLRDIAKFFLL
jgi:hypothetical protein